MKKRVKNFSITINNTKITYLYVQKNACTAWKQVFINESPFVYDSNEYSNPIAFMGKYHSASQEDMDNAEYNIVIIREPLGRIVSAFINQFVNRLHRQTSFHRNVSRCLNKPVEQVTFSDFVTVYLTQQNQDKVDSHFWSQKSHLGDYKYNKVIILDELYAESKTLFGEEFANKYFKKKLNATSNTKKYETNAVDLTTKELYDNFRQKKGWPSTYSFLQDEEIYSKLVTLYRRDIEFYDSHLGDRVSMLAWNEFRNNARVLKEACTLQKHKYPVTVHALKINSTTPMNTMLSSGVKVKRVKSKKPPGKTLTADSSYYSAFLKIFSQISAMLRMLFSVVRTKPDIIHAHDIHVLPIGWLASKFTGSKLVYDAHEISTDREGLKSLKKVVGYFEKKLIRRADKVITTTDMRAKFFSRAYGVVRPTVLQNRPNLYRYNATTRIREELKLKNPWPIAVYQGGLQSGRGLERLIHAAKEVENVYVVLIGSGPLEHELKGLANELRVNSKVKFIPVVPLSELPEYTGSADIGIQPILNTCLNHYTTDSNKLFEYVLAGLPVITTDFPEIRRIIKQYKVGLLINESVDSLAVALKQLVVDVELRQQYKSNAIKSREKLSWGSQEMLLTDLYNNIKASDGIKK